MTTVAFLSSWYIPTFLGFLTYWIFYFLCLALSPSSTIGTKPIKAVQLHTLSSLVSLLGTKDSILLFVIYPSPSYPSILEHRLITFPSGATKMMLSISRLLCVNIASSTDGSLCVTGWSIFGGTTVQGARTFPPNSTTISLLYRNQVLVDFHWIFFFQNVNTLLCLDSFFYLHPRHTEYYHLSS